MVWIIMNAKIMKVTRQAIKIGSYGAELGNHKCFVRLQSCGLSILFLANTMAC